MRNPNENADTVAMTHYFEWSFDGLTAEQYAELEGRLESLIRGYLAGICAEQGHLPKQYPNLPLKCLRCGEQIDGSGSAP